MGQKLYCFLNNTNETIQCILKITALIISMWSIGDPRKNKIWKAPFPLEKLQKAFNPLKQHKFPFNPSICFPLEKICIDQPELYIMFLFVSFSSKSILKW